jgi:hypothetical protein
VGWQAPLECSGVRSAGTRRRFARARRPGRGAPRSVAQRVESGPEGAPRDLPGIPEKQAQRIDEHGGRSLPAYVERELRAVIACGDIAHGFCRVRCPCCALDLLVAFSCKSRGFCPIARGTADGRARDPLVDGVIPDVPTGSGCFRCLSRSVCIWRRTRTCVATSRAPSSMRCSRRTCAAPGWQVHSMHRPRSRTRARSTSGRDLVCRVSPRTSPAGPALAPLGAAIGNGPAPERLGTAPKRGAPRAINGPRGPEHPLSSAYPLPDDPSATEVPRWVEPRHRAATAADFCTNRTFCWCRIFRSSRISR